MVGLAVLSALVTFFFIQPLTTDGMEVEDRKVWSPYSKFGIFHDGLTTVPRIPGISWI